MDVPEQAALIVRDIVLSGVGPTRHITLNRPEKRNCLTAKMLERIAGAIGGAADRVIVLSGRGSAFCSGLDQEEFVQAGSADNQIRLLIEVLRLFTAHPRATVSLIGGAARAGGVGLGCCADLVVVDPQATFGIPFDKPYRPMSPILVPILAARRNISERAVGAMFDETLTADQARKLGLVDLLGPVAGDDTLSDTVLSALRDRDLLGKTEAIRPLSPTVIDEASRRRRAATSPEATADLLDHLGRQRGIDRGDLT